MTDIIIIGGGPAGLTAAVYGRRNGKSVQIIEKSVFGGQITNSPRVENIPGFAAISGDEFADQFLEQAIGLGAEAILEEVVEVASLTADPDDVSSGNGDQQTKGFVVRTAEGGFYEGRALILATGTTHRLLGLPGEEDLIGDGISFCAVCDGDFYRDKKVVMIGGGNSAFVEANLLAGIVSELVMLQDLPYFTADEASQKQLFSNNNVTTHVSTKILGYEVEDGVLCGVRYEEGGEEKVEHCDGVFLAVGLVPDNGAYAELAELNEYGYFASDEYCETRTPGVFVAGDARSKTLRQVATACADGAVAAMAAVRYLG